MIMDRCPWAGDDPLYLNYHDNEWGVPVHDDRKHFEFLVLESAQAGLSWITILRRRENYRTAYSNFDPRAVSNFKEADITKMLNNPGIIRNRKKIETSVNNAKRFLEIKEEYGSFDSYLWGFIGGKPVVNRLKSVSEIPAKTELSEKISSNLKNRGFKFIGPTIIYAHLQAVGLVNDHIVSCFRFHEIIESSNSNL
jgi:DNA-3-methyladenine glycosylase I